MQDNGFDGWDVEEDISRQYVSPEYLEDAFSSIIPYDDSFETRKSARKQLFSMGFTKREAAIIANQQMCKANGGINYPLHNKKRMSRGLRPL